LLRLSISLVCISFLILPSFSFLLITYPNVNTLLRVSSFFWFFSVYSKFHLYTFLQLQSLIPFTLLYVSFLHYFSSHSHFFSFVCFILLILLIKFSFLSPLMSFFPLVCTTYLSNWSCHSFVFLLLFVPQPPLLLENSYIKESANLPGWYTL
jgi:hypothetical protein